MSDHLHYELDGSESRPALLLVHGFMSCNLQWTPNRATLSEHFRLIAVELWGHGKSPAPHGEEAYRVERYVAELERIREKLGIGRWLVCGQSFGAGIAMRYALARPEVVRGLVVTNSRSALNDVSREAQASGGLDTWEALDLRKLPLHPCHARRIPADLRAQMASAADVVDRHALWQATSTTASELSCREVANELSMPTLLVNGRFETSFQADRAFAAATIPDVEVVDLDAGHAVNIEASEGFDHALVQFAERIP